MDVQVQRGDFPSLALTWERLLPSCPSDSLFLLPLWQGLWWESFGEGAHLLLLSVQRGGEAIGIAPLLRRGEALSFLGDTDLFDYHDFIVPAGEEEAFFPALGEALEGIPWREALFSSLPEGSPTLHWLPQVARQRGWLCAVEEEDVAPGLPLPPSWDDYLRGLSKKDRHELRRKFRRLSEAAPYALSCTGNPQEVEGKMDLCLSLMRRSREEKRQFLVPQREAFFRRMARALAEAGYLRLFLLEVGEAPVACALCFDYRGRRLLYNSGFDPAYSSLSVGLLLKALCLKDALEQGMAYFDFLRGGEPYKYDLGGRARVLYRLVLRREGR